jgi:glycosyltransferase involved in cell wall biosynthesis
VNTKSRVHTLRPQRRKWFMKGHHQGRIDGFQRGREAGAAEGMQEFIASAPLEAGSDPFLGKALIITPSMALPSLEIVLVQPFRELKKLHLYDFNILVEESVSKEDIAAADTIIFLRNVEAAAYQYLEWAHELGKRTIYTIDDNFLEIPQSSDVGTYYGNPERIDVFRKFLKNTQLIKVDSLYFADYIRLYHNPNVVYFPASVDFSLLEEKERPVRNDDQVVIGYEGTNKEEDFAVVVPVLKRIIQEYGDRVRVEFQGFIPGELAYHPGVSFSSLSLDYRTYFQHLNQSGWDIGLAPLRNTVFNYCKTNNKYREYAACLIPGIYSDTAAYKDWVIQGETGLIVPHTSEGWYEGLKQMIDNPDLRLKVKYQAGQLAKQQFSIQTCVGNWLGHILRA